MRKPQRARDRQRRDASRLDQSRQDGIGKAQALQVIGNSMGGMHAWTWGVKYPQMMDALVPMASQPTAMAARNWMLRRAML